MDAFRCTTLIGNVVIAIEGGINTDEDDRLNKCAEKAFHDRIGKHKGATYVVFTFFDVGMGLVMNARWHNGTYGYYDTDGPIYTGKTEGDGVVVDGKMDRVLRTAEVSLLCGIEAYHREHNTLEGFPDQFAPFAN